jgi:hypothetical protein
VSRRTPCATAVFVAGPGPRRGHTAARAFQISPVQLANHAITCFGCSKTTVAQLAGPIAISVIRRAPAAASTLRTTCAAAAVNRLPIIQYAPSVAKTALSVLAISRRSLAIDQLST